VRRFPRARPVVVLSTGHIFTSERRHGSPTRPLGSIRRRLTTSKAFVHGARCRVWPATNVAFVAMAPCEAQGDQSIGPAMAAKEQSPQMVPTEPQSRLVAIEPWAPRTADGEGGEDGNGSHHQCRGDPRHALIWRRAARTWNRARPRQLGCDTDMTGARHTESDCQRLRRRW
jgi:hypothetical protein